MGWIKGWLQCARAGLFLTLAGGLALAPLTVQAWGRRGHQIVAEDAALLVAGEPQGSFLKERSFDLGYFANTPDFFWKREATYKYEGPQHYINLEVFERAFAKHPEIKEPFLLDRKAFEEKFPEIKLSAGRAYWRIREFADDLAKITQKLKDLPDAKGPARQKLQEEWLIKAGTMAHYFGDLGMPLHVSENHDGQMTDQKGVHSYFEDVLVNELYPELSVEVLKMARKRWPAFTKANHDKTPLELAQQIAAHSMKAVPVMLALDKKSKREDIKKNAVLNHELIKERLVDSVLAVAEMYRRNLGFPFDNDHFYLFIGEPEYAMPAAGAISYDDMKREKLKEKKKDP